MVYPVSRYDIKGKKLLTTNDKYYAVDLGLRNILLSDTSKSDIEHRLENVIYLELLRRKDNYPKTLLTMDLVSEEFNGIKKINVVDWLLGREK